jgi:hypothetical protein
MTAETYTCGNCRRTYRKIISDEEAAAKASEFFTPAELEATDVVCDDCWRLIEPELPRLRAELDQEAAAAGLGFDEFMRREARR